DRAVERPVEHDARRLAVEARVVHLLELRRGLRAGVRQFVAAVETWTGRGAATSAAAAARLRTAGRVDVFQAAQRNEPAARAAGIGHHDLLGGPIAGDVRLS